MMAASSAVHLSFSCAHWLKDSSRKNISHSLLTVHGAVRQQYSTNTGKLQLQHSSARKYSTGLCCVVEYKTKLQHLTLQFGPNPNTSLLAKAKRTISQFFGLAIMFYYKEGSTSMCNEQCLSRESTWRALFRSDLQNSEGQVWLI